MNIFIKAAAAVVILLLLAAAGVWLSLNVLLQRAVEKGGSKSLGVDVRLAQARLVVSDGDLTLSSLTIANPGGFQGQLFETASARTVVRPLAVFGLNNEVVIDTLVIESPSLHIEHSLAGTNLAKVLAEIERGEPKTGESRRQKTYRIRNLELTGAQVTIDSALTEKPPVVVVLPDIHMENVSSADGAGLTLAQVFEKVFVRMTQAAFKTGSKEIPAELLLNVSADLTPYAPELALSLPEKAKGYLERAQDFLKDLLKPDETTMSRNNKHPAPVPSEATPSSGRIEYQETVP